MIGPIPRAYSVGEETGKELQDSRAQVVVEVWGENPGWREERTSTGGITQLSLPGCGGACPHAGGMEEKLSRSREQRSLPLRN